MKEFQAAGIGVGLGGGIELHFILIRGRAGTAGSDADDLVIFNMPTT